jgi:hypothetical protein
MHIYDSEFVLSLFYNLLTVIEFADYDKAITNYN